MSHDLESYELYLELLRPALTPYYYNAPPPPPPPPTDMTSTAPKPFSLSVSSKPSTAIDRKDPTANKRSLAALGSDDEDSDHESSHRGKVQLVSGFDHQRGGALDASENGKKPASPLVIPALTNRDWRREAELRRGTKKAIYVPEEAKRGEVKEEDVREIENTGAGEMYGLQTFAKEGNEMEVDGEEEEAAPKVLTEDELAIAALMGTTKQQSDLVIAHASETNGWRDGRLDGNEDDAYRKDVSSRPDIPTLEDYAAVPVEEFGAALLRGMGWRGGEELGGKGRKPGDKSGKLRLVEKRPAFLGIGAKPVTDIPELGAWGKGDKKKHGRPDTTYIPVVKVDKRTGKIVNETAETKSNRNELERKNGSGRERSRELERNGSGRGDKKDGGQDRHSGRDRDSRRDRDPRREDDVERRRRRGRSSDRSLRNVDEYRESGRVRDRGGDRDRDRSDRKRDRDGGRNGERRRRSSRDRDYERRDRR